MSKKSSRRQFLRGTMGFLGGSMVARVTGLLPEIGFQPELATLAQVRRPLTQEEVELFEGFLILPNDSLIPAFVALAPAIDLHGHDEGFAGETIQLNSTDELRNYTSIPFYTLDSLSDIPLIDVLVTQYTQPRHIWGISINYGAHDNYDKLVSVWIRPMFHRPFPVWPVQQPEAYDEILIYPEKINFREGPALMLPTAQGHLIQWIKQDVLYGLVVEHSLDKNEALRVADSLERIS